jgi:hypothetical protein
VPSKNAPAYLTEKNIVGELAPGDFHGIAVLGSYGESWLCRTPVSNPITTSSIVGRCGDWFNPSTAHQYRWCSEHTFQDQVEGRWAIFGSPTPARSMPRSASHMARLNARFSSRLSLSGFGAAFAGFAVASSATRSWVSASSSRDCSCSSFLLL